MIPCLFWEKLGLEANNPIGAYTIIALSVTPNRQPAFTGILGAGMEVTMFSVVMT